MTSAGETYENEAAALVTAEGLRIVTRNFRGKPGEIDIIASDDSLLVFIEVRARNNPLFSSAAGSVDARKQQRIVRTAQLYLQQHPQLANMPCRFDVIAFEPPQSPTSPRIRWIRGAFTA